MNGRDYRFHHGNEMKSVFEQRKHKLGFYAAFVAEGSAPFDPRPARPSEDLKSAWSAEMHRFGELPVDQEQTLQHQLPRHFEALQREQEEAAIHETTSLRKKYLKSLRFPNLSVNAEALQRTQAVGTLQMTGCRLSDAGMPPFVHLLKTSSVLRRLCLQANFIGVDGCKTLSEGLRETKSLTDLDMSLNPFGDDGCTAICNALIENAHNSHVYRVNMATCRLTPSSGYTLSRLVRDLSSLTTLLLWRNNLGCPTAFPSGVALILDELRSVSTMRVLNLTANCISNAFAAAHAAAKESDARRARVAKYEREAKAQRIQELEEEISEAQLSYGSDPVAIANMERELEQHRLTVKMLIAVEEGARTQAQRAQLELAARAKEVHGIRLQEIQPPKMRLILEGNFDISASTMVRLAAFYDTRTEYEAEELVFRPRRGDELIRLKRRPQRISVALDSSQLAAAAFTFDTLDRETEQQRRDELHQWQLETQHTLADLAYTESLLRSGTAHFESTGATLDVSMKSEEAQEAQETQERKLSRAETLPMKEVEEAPILAPEMSMFDPNAPELQELAAEAAAKLPETTVVPISQPTEAVEEQKAVKQPIAEPQPMPMPEEEPKVWAPEPNAGPRVEEVSVPKAPEDKAIVPSKTAEPEQASIKETPRSKSPTSEDESAFIEPLVNLEADAEEESSAMMQKLQERMTELRSRWDAPSQIGESEREADSLRPRSAGQQRRRLSFSGSPSAAAAETAQVAYVAPPQPQPTQIEPSLQRAEPVAAQPTQVVDVAPPPAQPSKPAAAVEPPAQPMAKKIVVEPPAQRPKAAKTEPENSVTEEPKETPEAAELLHSIARIGEQRLKLKELEEKGSPSDEDLKKIQKEKDQLGGMKRSLSSSLNIARSIIKLSPRSAEIVTEFFVSLIRETDLSPGNSTLVQRLTLKVDIDFASLVDSHGLAALAACDSSMSFLKIILGLPKVRFDVVELVSSCFFNQMARIPLTLFVLSHAAVPVETVVDELQPLWQEFFEDISSAKRSIPREDRRGRMELLALMLNKPPYQVDVANIGGDGQNVVSRACHDGDLDLVKLLVRANSVSNIKVNEPQPCGITLLQQAVISDNPDIVALLLDQFKESIDLNAKSENGTALDLAVGLRRNPAIVSMLTERGAMSAKLPAKPAAKGQKGAAKAPAKSIPKKPSRQK